LLDTALAERDCEAEAYVRVFHRTGSSGYVDPAKLWSFVAGADLRDASDPAHARYAAAKVEVARLVDGGIAHGFVAPASVIEGITVERLAQHLSTEHLRAVLRGALDAGRRNAPFADADVLLAVPSDVLVEQLPLAAIVDGVLVPMARNAGL